MKGASGPTVRHRNGLPATAALPMMMNPIP
jgi:hypothetical protein